MQQTPNTLMLRDLTNEHTDFPAHNVFEHVRCIICLASHDLALGVDNSMQERAG